MTRLLLRLGKVLKILLTSPLWILCVFTVSLSKNRTTIFADATRYGIINGGGYKALVYRYIFNEKCFRNILYYRLNPVVSWFLKLFFKENPTLHIGCQDVGPGFLVVHGDATYIYAKSVGKNLYVNQCVTIGVVGTERPIIGDNVRVATGALVIGGISIGDNVIIGGGSVVTKNVPNNSVVVGNPARIVKKDGKKVNIPL